MDIKDFIKETITAIVKATAELQAELGDAGAIINPPVSSSTDLTFRHDSPTYTKRAIKTVEFDIAVTASAETAGDAKAGLKVWSIEAGAAGSHTKGSSEVSRVRFQIPVVLPASKEEANNLIADRQQKDRLNRGAY